MTVDTKRDLTKASRPQATIHPRGRFMAGMRRFARDQGGVGAIMFAFALPVPR